MKDDRHNQLDDLYNIDFYKSLSPEAGLQERQQGRLPILEIHGHPFFVEVRLHQLRPKDNFLSPGITLDPKRQFNSQSGLYSIYYDVPNMIEAIIAPGITELPKNVVLIRFPSMVILDPYMSGRLSSTPEVEKLVRSTVPMVMYRKAQEIALKDSPLMDIVNRNIQELKFKRSKPKMVMREDPRKSRRR